MIKAVHTGDDVLEWLRTDDAARQARRLIARRGLSSSDVLADDVLNDAWIAVRLRMQSPKPLVVETPGAYGTAVLRSVVRLMAKGRRHLDVEELTDLAGDAGVDLDHLSLDEHALLDDLRVVVERMGAQPLWLTSALLSLVTLRAHPELRVDGVPTPQAGATPDQARAWPALWFAGRRDIFPDRGDDHRERARKNTARARLIRTLHQQMDVAGVQLRDELGVDHG